MFRSRPPLTAYTSAVLTHRLCRHQKIPDHLRRRTLHLSIILPLGRSIVDAKPLDTHFLQTLQLEYRIYSNQSSNNTNMMTAFICLGRRSPRVLAVGIYDKSQGCELRAKFQHPKSRSLLRCILCMISLQIAMERTAFDVYMPEVKGRPWGEAAG